MAKRKSGGDDKKNGRPPLMKRQQKTMLLAQSTVDLLEKARWDLRKSYGVLIDEAVSVVYGNIEAARLPDDLSPQYLPAAKLPDPLPPEQPSPRPAKRAPDEYDEYCQMRGLYEAAQLEKSARGKELVRLYEARYQSERRGV